MRSKVREKKPTHRMNRAPASHREEQEEERDLRREASMALVAVVVLDDDNDDEERRLEQQGRSCSRSRQGRRNKDEGLIPPHLRGIGSVVTAPVTPSS